ncbi:MAG: hypothetical protein DHS20C15_27210 [Planctomycetota bacterium]|nr:MAG: hypothetical protein DHS20C15_27210 [Planctomycetota bacterium]
MADAYVPPEPSKMAIPPVESPFVKEFLSSSELDDATKQQALFYAENGYLVIDLELPDFDEMCERMIRDLDEHYPKVDVGRRIDEAWYYNDDVRKLAAAPKVLDVLQLLYQRPAFPFQTLNFDVGTEQPAHSDTIHFHCMPRRYMVGVWAPLEDVDAQCGTLFVVPGSHKLPDYDMSELGLLASSDSYRSYEDLVRRILDVCGLKSQIVELKRGQAVIWSANLFHGGSPRLDPKRTRHSQATHYYFEDCMYYMPMESDTFGGSICYREAIDIGTGRMMPQTYRGAPLELAKQKKVFRYPRPLPQWVTGVPRSLKDRIIG